MCVPLHSCNCWSASRVTLAQLETGIFEFRNPAVERSTSLTPADRKWMDEIVRDVNESWSEANPSRPIGMQYVLFNGCPRRLADLARQGSKAVMTICVLRYANIIVKLVGSSELAVQFDEYISAALSSVKYADFIAKGEASGVLISGAGTAKCTPSYRSFTHRSFRQAVTTTQRSILTPCGSPISVEPTRSRYGVELPIPFSSTS